MSAPKKTDPKPLFFEPTQEKTSDSSCPYLYKMSSSESEDPGYLLDSFLDSYEDAARPPGDRVDLPADTTRNQERDRASTPLSHINSDVHTYSDSSVGDSVRHDILLPPDSPHEPTNLNPPDIVTTPEQEPIPVCLPNHPSSPCARGRVNAAPDSIAVYTPSLSELGTCYGETNWTYEAELSVSRTDSNTRTRIYIQTQNHIPVPNLPFRPVHNWKKPTFVKLEDFASIKVGTITGCVPESHFNALRFEVYLNIITDDTIGDSGYCTTKETLSVVAAFELATHYSHVIRDYAEAYPEKCHLSDISETDLLDLEELSSNAMMNRRRPEKDNWFSSCRIAKKSITGRCITRFLEYVEHAFIIIGFNNDRLDATVRDGLQAAIDMNAKETTQLEQLFGTCRYIACNKLIECKAVNTKRAYKARETQWYQQLVDGFDFADEAEDVAEYLNENVLPHMREDVRRLFHDLLRCRHTLVTMDIGAELYPMNTVDDCMILFDTASVKEYTARALVDRNQHIARTEWYDGPEYDFAEGHYQCPEYSPIPKTKHYLYEALGCAGACSSTNPKFYLEVGYHLNDESYHNEPKKVFRIPRARKNLTIQGFQLYHPCLMDGQPYEPHCRSLSALLMMFLEYTAGKPSLLPIEYVFEQLQRQCAMLLDGVDHLEKTLSRPGHTCARFEVYSVLDPDEGNYSPAESPGGSGNRDNDPLVDTESDSDESVSDADSERDSESDSDPDHDDSLGEEATESEGAGNNDDNGVYPLRFPVVRNFRLQDLVKVVAKSSVKDYIDTYMEDNASKRWIKEYLGRGKKYEVATEAFARISPEARMAMILGLQALALLTGCIQWQPTLFRHFSSECNPWIPRQIPTSTRVGLSEWEKRVTGLKYGAPPAVIGFSYLSPSLYNGSIRSTPDNVLPYMIEAVTKSRMFYYPKTTLINYVLCWNIVTMFCDEELRTHLCNHEEYDPEIFDDTDDAEHAHHRHLSNRALQDASPLQNDAPPNVSDVQQSGNQVVTRLLDRLDDEDEEAQVRALQELAVLGDDGEHVVHPEDAAISNIAPEVPDEAETPNNIIPDNAMRSHLHNVDPSALCRLTEMEQRKMTYLLALPIVRGYDQHWHAYMSSEDKFPPQNRIATTDRHVSTSRNDRYNRRVQISDKPEIWDSKELMALVVGDLDVPDHILGRGWKKDGTRHIVKSLAPLYDKVEEARQQQPDLHELPSWSRQTLFDMIYLVFVGQERCQRTGDIPIVWHTNPSRMIPDTKYEARKLVRRTSMSYEEVADESVPLWMEQRSAEYRYSAVVRKMKEHNVDDNYWVSSLLTYNRLSVLSVIIGRAFFITVTRMINEGRFVLAVKHRRREHCLVRNIGEADSGTSGCQVKQLFASLPSLTAKVRQILKALGMGGNWDDSMLHRDKISAFREYQAIMKGGFLDSINWLQWFKVRVAEIREAERLGLDPPRLEVSQYTPNNTELIICQDVGRIESFVPPSTGMSPTAEWYQSALKLTLAAGQFPILLWQQIHRDRKFWFEQWQSACESPAFLGEVPFSIRNLITDRTQTMFMSGRPQSERSPPREIRISTSRRVSDDHHRRRSEGTRIKQPKSASSEEIRNAERYIEKVEKLEGSGVANGRSRYGSEHCKAVLEGVRRYGVGEWLSIRKDNAELFKNSPKTAVHDLWKTLKAERPYSFYVIKQSMTSPGGPQATGGRSRKRSRTRERESDASSWYEIEREEASAAADSLGQSRANPDVELEPSPHNFARI